MANETQQYHSLIFQLYNDPSARNYNTWDNWHLIPSARPVVAQPNPVYNYVDIPGSDGSMDLTDYLVGRPTYSDRTGSFEFYVENDHGDWASRRAEIASFFNGRRMKMYLADDPQYYYDGRFFFRAWTPDASHSKVTIEYRLKPYRYLSTGKEAGL